MIAVTCRDGEHVSLEPDAIERVEHDVHTVVILGNGTKFVVGQTIDDLVRIVRDHRAAQVSARRRMAGRVAAPGYVPGRPYRTAVDRVPVPAGRGPAPD